MTKPIPLTVLKRAKALIEEGWIQGYSYDFNGVHGFYCSTGAINSVLSHAKDRYDAAGTVTPYGRTIINDYLNPVVPDPPLGGIKYSVVGYNDAPTTTKQDVLALFDRAIELASQKG